MHATVLSERFHAIGDIIHHIRSLSNEVDYLADEDDGWAILHRAAQTGNVKIFKEVLRAWPDLSVQTSTGLTVLDVALSSKSRAAYLNISYTANKNQEFVTLLEYLGAQPGTRREAQGLALHGRITESSWEARSTRFLESVDNVVFDLVCCAHAVSGRSTFQYISMKMFNGYFEESEILLRGISDG